MTIKSMSLRNVMVQLKSHHMSDFIDVPTTYFIQANSRKLMVQVIAFW